MKTVRIVVTGRVTGVGFRFSAVNQARQHGNLRGWVRNRDARTVEAMVQGSEDTVDAMIEWFRRGPPGARVRQCHVETIESSEKLDWFQVVY